MNKTIKKKGVGEKNVKNVKNAKLHEKALYAEQIKTTSMCSGVRIAPMRLPLTM